MRGWPEFRALLCGSEAIMPARLWPVNGNVVTFLKHYIFPEID
jgi:hypothetical protein